MRTLKRFALCLLALFCCVLPVNAAAQSLAAEQQLNACYTLMTLSLSEGDFEAALDYADQCLEMDELLDDALRADIYLKQGYALLYLQRPEQAQTALDACLELLPGAADAMLLKLQACAAMGDAQGAREQARAYLEAYPEQTEVYSVLGELLAAMGDYAGAADAYASYIASVEEAPASAYEMRGQCLLQMGRYEEAVADLSRAVDLGDEAQPRTHYLRAIARMQLGDNEAAVEDLDVCVDHLEAEEARMAEDASPTCSWAVMRLRSPTLPPASRAASMRIPRASGAGPAAWTRATTPRRWRTSPLAVRRAWKRKAASIMKRCATWGWRIMKPLLRALPSAWSKTLCLNRRSTIAACAICSWAIRKRGRPTWRLPSPKGQSRLKSDNEMSEA